MWIIYKSRYIKGPLLAKLSLNFLDKPRLQRVVQTLLREHESMKLTLPIFV